MAHQLPPLPYDFGALEPHIDAQTMQIHHGKHHQAYVNNLNAALEKHPQLQSKSAEDLIRDLGSVPEDVRTAVRKRTEVPELPIKRSALAAGKVPSPPTTEKVLFASSAST